ncbi:Sucrase/ferredoxin-like family protein, putative isoform 2 [Hibiscus syriacus]|uniref:Sucrase/ferredoxin-like family protein, putative isoform 2 n=1 Tax=Hibiscus syriacus TaxID=106335 RepID=A0A6A3A1R2_HIBSY|nr:Sucrase/ferredoxin-like family protein, putative isoform 2 [Hibiscus syriacus]
MADSSYLSTVSTEDAASFGFTRDEMYTGNLAGTVNPYDRHLFLRHKSYTDWASRVEEDGLPNLLSSALKSRKNDIPFKTLLTVVDGAESDGDVLIFPEMIKYKGLTDSDVDGFVEDVLVNVKAWTSGPQETLSGSYIFVCAHGNRDKRCGVCGPALIQKLNEEIELRGLKDQVFETVNTTIPTLPCHYASMPSNGYPYYPVFYLKRLQGSNGGFYEEGEQKLPSETEAKKNENEEATAQNTTENVGGCCQLDVQTENLGRSMGQRDILMAAAAVGAVVTVAVAYSYYRRSG